MDRENKFNEIFIIYLGSNREERFVFTLNKLLNLAGRTMKYSPLNN